MTAFLNFSTLGTIPFSPIKTIGTWFLYIYVYGTFLFDIPVTADA